MLKEFFDDALSDLRKFKGNNAPRNGQVELRDKWNINPNAYARNSDHFYEHEVGDSYLYDLAAWHSSKTLYPWGQKVHGTAKGEVWDFGGGIGTYSLLCAAKPTTKTVFYDEINPENIEFAQWRFKKYGLLKKIKMGPPSGKVDVIVALDVIEHLSDPIGQIVKFDMAAVHGAEMVVNVTAHTSGGEHPMHIMDASDETLWWAKLRKTWDQVGAGSPSIWRKK